MLWSENRAKFQGDVQRKAELLKRSFVGCRLVGRPPKESQRHMCDNAHMLPAHLTALLVFAQFNRLKTALLDSYGVLSVTSRPLVAQVCVHSALCYF